MVRKGIPRRARLNAKLRPVGPAPTIKTEGFAITHPEDARFDQPFRYRCKPIELQLNLQQRPGVCLVSNVDYATDLLGIQRSMWLAYCSSECRNGADNYVVSSGCNRILGRNRDVA